MKARSPWLDPQDNRLTGERRAHAAEGFFGCDEFGHLYISALGINGCFRK